MEIRIVIDDRIVRFLARKRVLASLVVVAALGAVSTDAAPTFMVPNTFGPGSVISSSQMNQNFAAISDRLNDHENRISGLESLPQIQFFIGHSQSATVPVPLGAHRMVIEAIGSGGGGGGANASNSGGSGGFGAFLKAAVSVTGGQSVTVNVGQGGGAGSNNLNACSSVTPSDGGAGNPTIVSGTDAFGNSYAFTANGGGAGLGAISCGNPAPASAGIVGYSGTAAFQELPVGVEGGSRQFPLSGQLLSPGFGGPGGSSAGNSPQPGADGYVSLTFQ